MGNWNGGDIRELGVTKRQKMKYQIGLLLLLIAILNNSCEKEDLCPNTTDLGQLEWSQETENWFPQEYMTKPFSIDFTNNNGEIKTFTLDTVGILQGLFWNFEMECENGEGTINVRYATKRLFGNFESEDSIRINFGIGVWNERIGTSYVNEADFYEWIAISMWQKISPDSLYDIGRIRVVTDLRNSELFEIEYQPNVYSFHHQRNIGGNLLSDVYNDGEKENPESDLYFQRGNGLIAFRDKNGELWIKN